MQRCSRGSMSHAAERKQRTRKMRTNLQGDGHARVE